MDNVCYNYLFPQIQRFFFNHINASLIYNRILPRTVYTYLCFANRLEYLSYTLLYSFVWLLLLQTFLLLHTAMLQNGGALHSHVVLTIYVEYGNTKFHVTPSSRPLPCTYRKISCNMYTGNTRFPMNSL